MAEPPPFLTIGRIVAVHGAGSELRVEPLTDFPERFLSVQQVHVGEQLRPYRVLGVQPTRGQFIVRLADVDQPDEARKLVGALMRVPLADAVPLPSGEYYWYQIIGATVVTTAGDELGTVQEIIRTGANDVYIVRGPLGEVLIPAIEDVVRQIDPSAGRIVVEPLPGLLPERGRP